MSNIVNNLIANLETTLGIKGYRGLQFLHNINDYPSFYLHAGKERFAHIGAGVKLKIIEAELRVYNYSDNLEDIEILLRRFESAIDSYFSTEADEFRVLEVSTDEGLMSPYQLADIKLEILYRKI